jgi:Protein of unknown function (DUF3108)
MVKRAGQRVAMLRCNDHIKLQLLRCEIITAMTIARFAALSAIAALSLAAALPLVAGVVIAPAAEADSVTARFEVFGFAGLHVLTNRTTIEEAANQYAITMDLDTRGLASLFVDLTSHSEVHGKLAGNTLRPESYRAEVRRNGADRHYRLDYPGDDTVINASTPSSGERPLLIAAEQMRGTVDQLTAFFLLERQVARRGTCALVVPVFDGSSLYDLRFTDVKRETLAADSYQNFAGPTQVCAVVRKDIVASRNGYEDTYRHGKIWYARLMAGDRMIPVRMQFDTAFGAVTGYLAELRGQGFDLHLTRK